MAFRPQPFGRYDLLDRISAGGMAEVFKARDKDRDLVVALKRILPEVAEDEEFIAMFEDEARIVSTLEHPHIARALDFGQHESEWFIAFEYVEGRDMRKLWNRCVERNEHPPLAVLLYIFARVGEGLAYAHARKDNLGRPTALVHRDVSPQNIVVSFDGDVKLIDFGIAKAQGKLARTQAGTIKGKFGYMAPEQVRGLEVDQRADVFALGVCIWEALTLRRLFAGENELKILEKIRTLVVPPPSSVNPDVPKALDDIVLHALAKNVDDRHRAAKELYREINVFSHDYGEVATREEVAQYMRHSFPESGKALEDRVPISRTKGGRRSSASLPVMTDPYQLADLGDEDNAATGLHDPLNDNHPDREDRTLGADSDLGVFEGAGKTSAHRLSSASPSTLAATIGPANRGSLSPSTHLPSTQLPSTQLPPTVSRSNVPPVGTPLPVLPFPSAPPPRISVPPTAPAATIPMTTLLSATSDALAGTRTPPPPPGRGQLPSVSGMVTAPRLVPPPAPFTAGSTTPAPGPTPLGRPQTLAPLPPPQAPPRQPSYHAIANGDAGLAAPAATPLDWDDDASTNIIDRPIDLYNLGKPGSGAAPPADPSAGMLLPKNGSPTLLGLPVGNSSLPAPSLPRPSRGRAPVAPATSPLERTTYPLGAMSPVAPGYAPPGPTYGSGFPPPSPPFQPQIVSPPDAHHAADEGSVDLTDPTLGVAHLDPQQRPPSMRSRMEATLFVRRGSSSVGMRLGLGIAAAIALTAMVLFFFAGPKTGRLVVNVSDAKGGPVEHLEVFVDGKKNCDTTPCYADQLSAGLHEVKVLAEGYDAPAARGTTIESRKDTTVSFTLVGNSRVGSGVKIAGSQPGVKLYVDGSEVGPLPQDIRTLSPGEHRLRLAGSDRYAPLERSVTLGRDEVQDLGQQTLKVIRGKATIASAPSGAKVYIVAGSDRHELPSWPMSVDIDTSKQWWLEAVKPGFTDYQQLISFDDGVAEKSFVIDLQPKSAAPPVPDPGAAANDSPAPRPQAPPTTPTPAPAREHHPAPVNDTSGDDSPQVASGEGYLNINSVPASSVVLDGKPIGQTPQVHVTVSAGSHQIVFVNADQGLKKQVTVTVGSGETKVAAVKLRAE
jgi:serine/threonine protein kinase